MADRRYDAVLFDLFGTLVETVSPDDYGTMLAAVAADLDAPLDPFTYAWRESLEERESGHLGPIESILGTTAYRAGVEPRDDAIATASETWLGHARRWLTPRTHTVATMQAFRDAGTRIGLVSNCSAEAATVWPETLLAPMVDHPTFSCDVGAMKPDPAIYHRTCEALDVRPERCVFVGDGGARELTGADALGMHAVLLRVNGEEHTWFDQHYRKDALEWTGITVRAIEDLLGLL